MSLDHRHFILNKPYGYLSQFTSQQRYAHKKKYLGELYDFPEGTMAIGRLDEASEGLLLLTTDGVISERARSKEIEKEYWVQLDGMISDKAIEQLESGVEIKIEGKSYQTLPAKAKKINEPQQLPIRKKAIRDERHGPTSWISISIREGKFRQIRKMTATVGFPTLRLIRARIGKIHLHSMKAGDCIEVTEFNL